MDRKEYSNELQETLSYIVDVLSKEFPTDIYSIEYIITSILDNKKTHANQILDNCLMTSNIEELKKVYIDWLEKNKKDAPYVQKLNGIAFSKELNDLLSNAEKECELLGSKYIGTEHIILAMLKPEYGNEQFQEVFRNIGVDYNFFLNKCAESAKISENISNDNSSKENKIPLMDNIPLKSGVNKSVTTSKKEFISQYTISLNDLAKEGKIDELIGRKSEVEQIIKVLARRKKNNAILVGKGGCGKTHIIYGLANKIIRNEVPTILQGKEIVMLDIMALVSGTHFRGMFEERVKGLFDELKSSNNYILFIDDMQSVLKSSSKDKDTDISSMISNILSGGEVKVIGTTTFKDYHNSIEINTSISRKLQKIVIEPTTAQETIDILEANKHYYEKHHNVTYSTEIIKKSVQLAERYITDRSLPDSAFDVVDLTGAYTCLIDREPKNIIELRKRLIEIEKERLTNLNCGNFEAIDELNNEENKIKAEIAEFKQTNKDKFTINITLDDIAKSVSDMTNIPVNKLTSNEKEKIAQIENTLKKSIVGQDEAIDKVCRIIKRNKVGLGDKNKTLGNCLLLGPSGVGKTLIAKKIAEEIFGSERDLIRIDMSEYSEKNSVAKLTGAAPGYIGYENGGQLTEAIKHKQHCVLLLDEIEKADQEVYNLFLQLFDEGRLTDSSGQIINFKNVIVLMTSNIGAKEAAEMGKGMGFVNDETNNKQSIVKKKLKQTFTPEFINRIDQIVYFNSLSDDNLRNIIKLEIEKFNKRLSEISFGFSYDESVVDYLFSFAIKEKEYGARPIIRLIQDNIEDKITDLILLNEYDKNYVFKSTVENGKLRIE